MSRKLLVETVVVTPLAVSLQESKRGAAFLTECLAKSKSPSYLVLKEEFDSTGSMLKPLRVILAATILDEENENGRTYRANIMECAILNESCKSALTERQLTCTVDGHPEDVYVEPGNASHIVTRAWVEGNRLMNEWEILETTKGKDLRALVDGRVKFGVSIRGLGSQDNYGNILDDYEYLGTDCVGNPSARLFVSPTVTESASSGKSTSSGVSNMKFNTAGDAKTYLQEQKILLGSDKDSIAKATRVLRVEQVINESGLSAPELAKLIPEIDAMKAQANGVTSLTESNKSARTAAPVAGSREQILQTENARLANKCAELEKRLGTDKSAGLREELAKARARLAVAGKGKKESGKTVARFTPVTRVLASRLKSEQAHSAILESVVQSVLTTVVSPVRRKKAESTAKRPARLYKLESITKFLRESGEEEGSTSVTWDVTNNLEPEDGETPVACISSDDSSVIYIYAPDEAEPYKLVDTENGVYVATSSIVDMVDQAVDKIDPEYLLSSDELEAHLDIDGGAEGGEEMEPDGDEDGAEDGDGADDEPKGEDEPKGKSEGRRLNRRTPRVTESASGRRAATASIRSPRTAVTEARKVAESRSRDTELHGIVASDWI